VSDLHRLVTESCVASRFVRGLYSGESSGNRQTSMAPWPVPEAAAGASFPHRLSALRAFGRDRHTLISSNSRAAKVRFYLLVLGVGSTV